MKAQSQQRGTLKKQNRQAIKAKDIYSFITAECITDFTQLSVRTLFDQVTPHLSNETMLSPRFEPKYTWKTLF